MSLVKLWKVMFRKKLTPDQKVILLDFIRTNQTLVLLAIAFIFGSGYLVFADYIPLTSATVNIEALSTFEQQVKFTAQYFLLQVTWPIISVLHVNGIRLSTAAADPTAGYEFLVFTANKLLTNSLEQAVISFMVQLSFLAVVEPSVGVLVKVIPWLNFLFFLGRLSFYAGYPKRRGYGMPLTMMPTMLMFLFTWMVFVGKLLNWYSMKI